MSFGNNLNFIARLADALPDRNQLLVLYRPSVEVEATELAALGIPVMPFQDNVHFVLEGVPKIMQARLIFCDNYYAFLGGLVHPRHAKIVQLWHANGAIKRFGWGDPKTVQRSKTDQRRFQRSITSSMTMLLRRKRWARCLKKATGSPQNACNYLVIQGLTDSFRRIGNKLQSGASSVSHRIC